VATVMSNLGLQVAVEKRGGKLVRTPVGDRYVVECMTQGNYNFGGEQSGHIVFLDHSTTGDGILSALQVLAVMLELGRPLSELRKVMERYPQQLVNVRVSNRKPIEEIPELVKLKEQMEQRLGDEGRLLIRPSGTEPVIRVMVEGADAPLIEEMASEMAFHIQKAMG